jgi:hypothetical protein
VALPIGVVMLGLVLQVLPCVISAENILLVYQVMREAHSGILCDAVTLLQPDMRQSKAAQLNNNAR